MEMTRRGLLGGLAAVGVVGVLAPGDLLASVTRTPPVEAPDEELLSEVWVLIPRQVVHDQIDYGLVRKPDQFLSVKCGNIFIVNSPRKIESGTKWEFEEFYYVATGDGFACPDPSNPLNSGVKCDTYRSFREAFYASEFGARFSKTVPKPGRWGVPIDASTGAEWLSKA